MASSNRTHLDILNQQDNTSLHQDNVRSKLNSTKKNYSNLITPPFFISQYLLVASKILYLDCQSPQEILLHRVHYFSTQPKQI